MSIATLPLAELFRTAPAHQDVQGVDREGHRILGAAVMQAGRLNDSRPWDIDDVTLESLVAFGNANPKGVKARFTHPSMSSDGLGNFLGRWTNFRKDDDTVRADLSIAESAAKSPKGDLRSYVLDLATEDPESFGNSIAFELDRKAMDKLEKDGRSPVRIAKLRAVDVVDEPASTRTGMFSADPRDIPEVIAAFLDTHFSGASPEVIRGRLDGYLTRYFDSRGLSMAEPKQDPQPTPEPAPQPQPTPEPTPQPEPKPDADFSAQLAAERQRVKAIHAVCGMARAPQAKVNEFIDNGASLAEVNLFCAAHLSAANPPVAGDPTEPDPDSKLKAEYRDHAETIRGMGSEPVSEEVYIKFRKRAG